MIRANEIRVDQQKNLTRREAEVLLWTAEGKTAQDTAAILGCAEKTVNVHLQSATRKLGALNKTHAVARAMLMRILVPLLLIYGLLALRGSQKINDASNIRERTSSGPASRS